MEFQPGYGFLEMHVSLEKFQAWGQNKNGDKPMCSVLAGINISFDTKLCPQRLYLSHRCSPPPKNVKVLTSKLSWTVPAVSNLSSLIFTVEKCLSAFRKPLKFRNRSHIIHKKMYM